MNNCFAAEQSVIGSLLLLGDLTGEQATKVMSTLKPASFGILIHQKAYASIKKISARGEDVNLINLENQMIRDGTADDDTFAYLAEMAKNTPSAAGVVGFANIVRQSSIERMAVSKLNEAMALMCDETSGDVYQRLGAVESMIGTILTQSMNSDVGGLRHIRDIGEEWTAEWQERDENPDAMIGYSSGLEELDRLLGPKLYVPGSLVVVGARPKMGKTAFQNLTIGHFALAKNQTVASFSLEMPSKQIFERMVSEHAKINPTFFYQTAKNHELSGTNYDSDMARVSAAIGQIIDTEIYIDDTGGIGISHIQRECRKLGKRKKIGLIAVDYLTLMSADKADTQSIAYGEITKKLKNLAKELNCVVLLLTQLNRALEQRSDKRPMPSDSRDTGQIEQDCDVWIGLYREGAYDEDLPAEQAGITEAIMRYNRHGQTGKVMLNLREGYFVPYDGPGVRKNNSHDDDY